MFRVHAADSLTFAVLLAPHSSTRWGYCPAAASSIVGLPSVRASSAVPSVSAEWGIEQQHIALPSRGNVPRMDLVLCVGARTAFPGQHPPN